MADETDARLELAHWRRLTAELYTAARRSNINPEETWLRFRETRDHMFASHPQSPLDRRRKESFRGLRYFPFNSAMRFTVQIAPLESEPQRVSFGLPEGRLDCRAFAIVRFVLPGRATAVKLTLFWLEGYGGGLFLPFKDQTSGRETFGGGRYLYDTIKGADLGAGPREIVLDFNYAYNPSCAYDAKWICPLAPAENALPLRIEAGELAFE